MEVIYNSNPINMLNLSIIVEQSAKRNPQKPAMSLGELTLNYLTLHEKICKTANALAKKGIGYGDKVAILCPNIPQFPIIFFAILTAGAGIIVWSTLKLSNNGIINSFF